MPNYLFRIEAVNLLANSVADCQQLSVLRGGSLSLLDAVKRLSEGEGNSAWQGATSRDAISNGSSSLLCSVECPDAEAVKRQVEDWLNRRQDELPIQHATFVVSYSAVHGEFGRQTESLVARNRWVQMQSASVSVTGKGIGVCKTDLLRPSGWGDKGEESRSVADRFRYGRDRKEEFYADYSGVKGLKFVHDLDELSKGGPEVKPKNLAGKIAVIHIDGNNFGRIQRGCQSKAALKAWDCFIQKKRRTALAELLTRIRGREEWKNGDELGLETLEWGGDEVVWILPASCGFAWLEAWFELSRQWGSFVHPEWKSCENPELIGKTPPLTHAASIVFCHHKAPIHRIGSLVRNLTETVKGESRTKDKFTYQVLESFDHLGPDFASYRTQLAEPFGGAGGLVLGAGELARMRTSMADLILHKLPRSKTIEIARAYAKKSPDQAKELEVRLDAGRAEPALRELKTALGEPMVWLHLAELWDYLEGARALTAGVA